MAAFPGTYGYEPSVCSREKVIGSYGLYAASFKRDLVNQGGRLWTPVIPRRSVQRSGELTANYG